MTKLKINIKKLSAVFFTMIVIATAMVVSGCGKTAIDIQEARLLKVELEGFDGNGTAVVSVNESKLKTLKKEYRDKKNYDDIKDVLESISFEMENSKINGTLSNGDKFNVVAKYDKELAEEVGVVLKNTTIECSVGDKLSEGIVIDAFKGVKIEYSGDNGDAIARVNSKGCDKIVSDQSIYFEIEGNNDDLKNGDKITVRASSFGDLEENGYFLKEETKVFTVEGLAGARETLEGVTFSDVAADMYDKVEDYLDSDVHLSNLDYEFESGKNRNLSTYKMDYSATFELVKYAYAYEEGDVSTNTLVAYYKVTTLIERTEDYYGSSDEFSKKGAKDTGISYIGIKSSSFKVKANNTIDDDDIYFTIKTASSIEKCERGLEIDTYKIEYYDKDYKKLDTTASTEATEPATEEATENATENATEATTDKATEKADETATEATTKKEN